MLCDWTNSVAFFPSTIKASRLSPKPAQMRLGSVFAVFASLLAAAHFWEVSPVSAAPARVLLVKHSPIGRRYCLWIACRDSPNPGVHVTPTFTAPFASPVISETTVTRSTEAPMPTNTTLCEGVACTSLDHAYNGGPPGSPIPLVLSGIPLCLAVVAVLCMI
ncbi:hypothetical protein BV25DRAFT_151956 [Artomyces pyxidatus]|uniref:Uncharacterized protein n=1 Tax=Artomyces pyxidatus TaxID=48021 RepID=A0ACB8T9G9_9AGAM|nr:hypothetical protein BV25DRAFT_151956 [Artomyces pyxidatus]